MSTSERAFRIELYREHLEEISFLYGQRSAVARDPELGWRAPRPFEDRLEAHIDALVVGGDLALETCWARALDGDSGELHAAFSVFCRQEHAQLLAKALALLEGADDERTGAATDALKLELPSVWHAQALRALAQRKDRLTRLLGTVIGYRRVPSAGVLADVIARARDDVLPRLIWTAGRLREKGSADAMRAFARDPRPEVRTAAERSLLRLGDQDFLSRLEALAGSPDCSSSTLGLAGGRWATAVLLRRLDPTQPDSETIIALGLLGDLSAVRPLCRRLAVESVSAVAAEALHVITGAELYETVFVPDAVHEDELFEREKQKFRASSEPPRRQDGQPFGTSVRRLARDTEVWEQWLQANAPRFSSQVRYRLGRPCSPVVLLDCLVSEHFPKSWRALVCDELLVRYGMDAVMEVDMPVAVQDAMLAAAVHEAKEREKQVTPGRWHVGGRLLAS